MKSLSRSFSKKEEREGRKKMIFFLKNLIKFPYKMKWVVKCGSHEQKYAYLHKGFLVNKIRTTLAREIIQGVLYLEKHISAS